MSNCSCCGAAPHEWEDDDLRWPSCKMCIIEDRMGIWEILKVRSRFFSVLLVGFALLPNLIFMKKTNALCRYH